VIGVDASAAAMAGASRRAARRQALPNALFAVAAAEQPPPELHGVADALRGIFGRDDAVLAGVERLLAAGASGEALVSVVPRDGVPAIPPADELGVAAAEPTRAKREWHPPAGHSRPGEGGASCRDGSDGLHCSPSQA
jgi:hypothetical protein